MLTILLTIVLGSADLPIVEVRNDNTLIRDSARIVIAEAIIPDQDGNGVIHIMGDDLVIDFAGAHLHGADPDATPDSYSGIGVRVTGRNNRILGGRFSGFKVAVHAKDADGLLIDGADVSDNFRQRLHSTPQAEATQDWLWPHRNDENEWMHNYGAGIYIEDSNEVTIRNVRARNVQNGIVLDRVKDSLIYDNDCSFLSGWGLALWRSSRNTISRNAFDFCVRGYSHGVYNRGQDSAGILLFEQCSDNIIMENSVTHGGDGIFGFAGREALGEANPRDDLQWYEQRGNSANLIIGNDLSYAVAHGLEMTFSSGNVVMRNRFVENAICGIWGGFSQHFHIRNNHFERNGDMPYGSERGGINIEHGNENVIVGNTFLENACGVFLWTRESSPLLELPWAKVNHRSSVENTIANNRFERDTIAIQLRRCGETRVSENAIIDVGTEIDCDEASCKAIKEVGVSVMSREAEPIGQARPVGARAHLAGREHIIMTEWGPYDYEQPLLHLHKRGTDRHVYRVLGEEQPTLVSLLCKTLTREEGEGSFATLDRDHDTGALIVRTGEKGRVVPYRLEAPLSSGTLRADDVLVAAEWRIRVFGWKIDPREDVEAWRREATAGVEFTLPHLQLRYGHRGPSQLPDAPPHVQRANLPTDRFGTIAQATLTFPPGRWRIRTVSDDGIRVWMNDEIVIDDWTHHAPTEHVHEFETRAPQEITLRVEHFELDGYALLTLDLEAADLLDE